MIDFVSDALKQAVTRIRERGIESGLRCQYEGEGTGTILFSLQDYRTPDVIGPVVLKLTFFEDNNGVRSVEMEDVDEQPEHSGHSPVSSAP